MPSIGDPNPWSSLIHPQQRMPWSSTNESQMSVLQDIRGELRILNGSRHRELDAITIGFKAALISHRLASVNDSHVPVIGFQAECQCGWRGAISTLRAEAESSWTDHVLNEACKLGQTVMGGS